MEAGRIELPSQEVTDVGLYMLRRCFVVVPHDEHRHPSRGIRRFFLAGRQRQNAPASPLFRLARRGHPRYAEVAYLIRQPLRGER